MTQRRCKNWLHTLLQYAEQTESPRSFWLWSGIFCLSAALQRKVWKYYIMDRVYPSLYVMLVAPPGWCRKSVPVKFARRILKQDLQLPCAPDAPTKRAFTKRLDELSRQCHYKCKDEETGAVISRPQAPISCVSPELSSFLSRDPKEMIEFLTDIYDAPDTFDYETSGAGEDHLHCPCVGCLFATTPKWMARNLPEEAIGGGFTSRFVIVSGTEPYGMFTDPPPPPKSLYQDLVYDLNIVANLQGEFTWGEGAFEFFDQWYRGLRQAAKEIMDERVQPFLSRIHTVAIKTAICLHAAYEESLKLEVTDIEQAIKLLTEVTKKAGEAFSSHGRSSSAIDTDRVMVQLRQLKELTFSDLLRINYRNTNKVELTMIIDTLEGMGVVRRRYINNKQVIKWLGRKGIEQ